MKVLDTVIWRDNATSRFESAFAVQQRFCTLNLLKPSEFFDFVFSVGAIYRTIKIWNAENDLGLLDIRRLGSVLGEGALLEKSELSLYYPPKLSWNGFRYRRIRVCPICISRGYHSPAHQVEWLDKCLIHGERLLANCPNCGISLDFRGNGNTIPLARYCCTACEYRFWPDATTNKWPEPLKRNELAPIADYLVWVKEWGATRKIIALYRANEFAGKCELSDRIAQLQSFVVERPRATEMAWRGDANAIPPQRLLLHVGTSKSKRIDECIGSIGVRNLVDFATLPRASLNSIDSIHMVARRLARYIEGQHRYCQHRIRNVVKSIDVQHEFDFLARSLCFPCFVASTLRTGFGYWGPSTNVTPAHEHEFKNDSFSHIRDRLQFAGLVKVAKRAGRPFSGSAEVTDCVLDPALELIVRFVVKEVVSSYTYWIFSSCNQIDKIENLFDREEALRDAALPGYRRHGAFFLPYAEAKDFVILSFRENVPDTNREWIYKFDCDHKKAVSERFREIQWLLEAGRASRFNSVREAVATNRRIFDTTLISTNPSLLV